MVHFAKLLFLRGLRCESKCGWRGLRFSRSQFRRGKRSLRKTLLVGILLLIVVVIVWHALTRAGSTLGGAHGDGIQEVE